MKLLKWMLIGYLAVGAATTACVILLMCHINLLLVGFYSAIAGFLTIHFVSKHLTNETENK